MQHDLVSNDAREIICAPQQFEFPSSYNENVDAIFARVSDDGMSVRVALSAASDPVSRNEESPGSLNAV